MRINERVKVAIGQATFWVERLSDTAWGVRNAYGDWCCVSEDGEGFGYLGEDVAISAVMIAEQVCDEAELSAA